MAKKNFYAVRVGRKTGIFTTWSECEKQVTGFKGSEFKGFQTRNEAQKYIDRKEKVQQSNQQIQVKEKPKRELTIEIKKKSLEVYIDGSYNHERKIAGYGLVIVKENEPFLKDFSAYPYEDVIVSHNVGVELLGAKRAVELALANDYKDVVIYYDYNGIEFFATGEWKPKIKQTKDYQMFMTKYMKLLNIHFVKIKSHSGNRFNNMADKLAKFATRL